MKVFAVIVLSYLFGSIPWGLVIGKVFYHKDIREEGSGNLGGTNAGRVLGKKAAISVTLLDAFKAFIAMTITHFIDPSLVLYSGLLAAVGHCFPIFAQFKGGKAVATAYGFFFGITVYLTQQWFFNFLFPILAFFCILYLTKMVSVSSISAVGLEALMSFFIHNDIAISLSLLGLWLFITYRHKANLQRVMNGTESKVKWMG